MNQHFLHFPWELFRVPMCLYCFPWRFTYYFLLDVIFKALTIWISLIHNFLERWRPLLWKGYLHSVTRFRKQFIKTFNYAEEYNEIWYAQIYNSSQNIIKDRLILYGIQKLMRWNRKISTCNLEALLFADLAGFDLMISFINLIGNHSQLARVLANNLTNK